MSVFKTFTFVSLIPCTAALRSGNSKRKRTQVLSDTTNILPGGSVTYEPWNNNGKMLLCQELPQPATTWGPHFDATMEECEAPEKMPDVYGEASSTVDGFDFHHTMFGEHGFHDLEGFEKSWESPAPKAKKPRKNDATVMKKVEKHPIDDDKVWQEAVEAIDQGDVTDEELRQFVNSEFRKCNETRSADQLVSETVFTRFEKLGVDMSNAQQVSKALESMDLSLETKKKIFSDALETEILVREIGQKKSFTHTDCFLSKKIDVAAEAHEQRQAA